MSPVKANSPVKGSKTPIKAKDNKFTPPKTRRRSMKPSTPKAATPIPATPEQKKTPKKQKTPKPEAQTPKAGKENKTPVLDKQTPKKVHSEKKKAPKATATPVFLPSRNMTTAEKEAADKKTLHLKGLTKETTEQKIKAVSTDIVEVRMRAARFKTKGSHWFAFVQFKSEASMTSNFEKMKMIDGKKVTVDYCGPKSTNKSLKRSAAVESVTDSTTLYCTGLACDSKDAAHLKTLLPKCTKIDIPTQFSSSKPRGFAFLHFENAKDAAVAKSSHDQAKVNGRVMSLSIAQVKVKEPRAKKAKKVAQQAESEEDDEDDSSSD